MSTINSLSLFLNVRIFSEATRVSGSSTCGLIWISNDTHTPATAVYLHCVRFAYLLLMKQGFNFLLLQINITLLEQMGGGRMGSMKKKQDNGVGLHTLNGQK